MSIITLADGTYVTKPKWHANAKERIVTVKDNWVYFVEPAKHSFSVTCFFSANDVVKKIETPEN